MPTGYTAGILDGTVTTFPQFAKECARAFGALIHMRDDPNGSEIKEREPSNFYSDALEKAKETLSGLEKSTDDQLFIQEKERIRDQIKRYLEYKSKADEGRKILEAMLKDVEAWQPPTKDHVGIKEFMIDQIKKTIDFDCDSAYWQKMIDESQIEFQSVNPKTLRQTLKAKAKKDVGFYTDEVAKEKKRCDDSNRWIKQFFESLEPVSQTEGA